MLRASTVDKRSAPIIEWVHARKKESGVPPTLEHLWYRCVQSCASTPAEGRQAAARQVYDHVVLEVEAQHAR